MSGGMLVAMEVVRIEAFVSPILERKLGLCVPLFVKLWNQDFCNEGILGPNSSSC